MTFELVRAAGIVVVLLYLGAVSHLFIARLLNSARSRRQDRIERLWLPILTAEAEEMPAMPTLGRRDLIPFLILWNHLQESFVGDIKHHLNAVAHVVSVDLTVQRMLRGRNLRKRLLAVSTLGHLADRAAWDALGQMTRHPDPLLSLAAARALTRIDASAALALILPRIADRDDWSRNYVLGMLSELGANVVSGPLTSAALQAPPGQVQRLLQYFSVAHVADAVPVVRSIIGRTDNVECLAACLRVFADVEDLDTVREYVHHPSWQVRVQAVNVLAHLGSADDYACLASLLSDPEWWVRYRAAQTLCTLPGIALSKLKLLSTQHDDPFARDMLVHVLAEAGA